MLRFSLPAFTSMSDVELFRKAIELTETGQAFAFASVIRAFGSTPQKAGANAIFAADGRMWGTLGGGCLEAECRQRALQSLDVGAAEVFDLRLDDIQGWDDGLICGGRVRVMVDPKAASQCSAYRRLVAAAESGEPGSLVMTIAHPESPAGKCEFRLSTSVDAFPEIGNFPRLAELIENGQAGSVDGEVGGEKAELYYEPCFCKPMLVIAGAGHVGKATAHLGNLMGFEVAVVDDRPSLANAENIPDAHQTICGDIPKEVAALKTNMNTYVVIVTRGHRHDGKVLAATVKKPAAFIGMIGSRRKGLMIRRGLVEEGLATEAELERVCSPIGVDIGAITVQEIALSIITQIVAVRRKRTWGALAMNYGLEDHGNRPCGGAVDPDGAAEIVAPVGR